MQRAVMFWAFVTVAALAVYVYPLLRLQSWLAPEPGIGLPTAIALLVSVVLALRLAFTGRYLWLRTLMVNWMGIGLILFCLCVVYEFLRLFLPTSDRAMAIVILVAGALLTLFSVRVANRWHHHELTFESSKLDRDYHIVQLSDVHIGSRSPRFLHQLVSAVNAKAPDYVVITGDLVDMSHVGRDELRALADIAAPTLFSVGNHDRYVGLERLLPILEDLGVQVLRNESVHANSTDVEFIAIDDAEPASHVATVLPTIAMTPTRFRILLYHRPTGFESTVAAGIELQLSGHTHHGQIVPFDWVVKRQFKRHKGLHEGHGDHGPSRLYVSPGSGTWGPNMRLGTRNEITSIRLRRA